MSEWLKVRKGVWRKPLAKDPRRKLQMDVLRIEPDFVDVPHWHDDFEWVYILKGSLEDEKGLHKKGDFIVNDKDAHHRPTSKEGCTALIVWCGSVRKGP
jgi:anti-sigma factor ChrR (cupin superfamily)